MNSNRLMYLFFRFYFLTIVFIPCSLLGQNLNYELNDAVGSRQINDDKKRLDVENFAFPDGKLKCLIMSFDDGPAHDRVLVKKLNKAGIIGTFHFNSARLGKKAKWLSSELGYDVHFVNSSELKTIYKNHEISSHSANHIGLKGVKDTVIKSEVFSDIEKLNGLINNTNHKPVQGLAYPFGSYDATTIKVLSELGVRYARTTAATHSFKVPTSNFLVLNPTCHISEALNFSSYFLNNKIPEMQVLNIWGHSYEFHNNWKLADSICNTLGNQKKVWYAQTIELITYVSAIKNLEYKSGMVFNPSKDISVWIKNRQGNFVELPPRQSITTHLKSSYKKENELDRLYPSKSMVVKYHGDWTKNHYVERIESFKGAPLNFGDVVFVGNSITEQGGDWSKKIGLPKIKNRGISGDVTDGVLRRLNEITYYKPKAVFLLIGINDLFNLHYKKEIPSPEYVANNILKITQDIYEKSPTTKIYLQTILPTSKEIMKVNINTVNTILKQNEGSSNYQLVNLFDKFVGVDGLISKKLTSDGTHLNKFGYNLWVSIVKPIIHKN